MKKCLTGITTPVVTLLVPNGFPDRENVRKHLNF